MGADAPIEHDFSWPVVSLAEIATKIGSGATPKGGADAYLPSRARFALVRSQNVFDRRFDHNGLAFITDEQADGLRGVILQPDDILLNITGDGITFGRACMVPKDVLPACVNQHVSIIRLDPQRADAGYVLAFLTHPDVKLYIESFNAGGSRRAVTKGHIESFRLPLPPLPEQRAIAHILGTLDDKIELNRRMNETLEVMARALFKSWFVDFDPVRAKAEGRDTGLPESIASLFPDRLEECELGRIPTGWETCRLGDLLDVDKGLSYKGQFLSDSGIPMVNLGCFLGHGRFAEQAIKNYSGEFQSRHVIRPGDLVLANTDITQKREVIGSPALVPLRDDLDELIFSHHVYAVRFHEGKEPWKLFVYFLLLQDGFRERATGFATGTTVLALPRDAITDLSCPAAPLPLLQAFDSLVLPLIHAQWQSMKQSQILAATRDALLPKLISGELRVPYADCVAELS